MKQAGKTGDIGQKVGCLTEITELFLLLVKARSRLQHWPIELSTMAKWPVSALDSSHWSHVNTEHLKCGYCN